MRLLSVLNDCRFPGEFSQSRHCYRLKNFACGVARQMTSRIHKDGSGTVRSRRTSLGVDNGIEKLPRTAEVQTLTADAQAQAEAAGYDVELFYAVSWAQFPDTVKYQFKTGDGTFDVTYLVGEHWSPNNRGFDIFIEEDNVEPLYVTPGQR